MTLSSPIRPSSRPLKRALLISACLMAAACDPSTEEAGPGGVSAGEAEALDDAAEIIEARKLPLEAVPQTSGDAASGNAPLPPEKPAKENGGNAQNEQAQ